MNAARRNIGASSSKNYIEYGILPSRLFNNLVETKMFLE